MQTGFSSLEIKKENPFDEHKDCPGVTPGSHYDMRHLLRYFSSYTDHTPLRDMTN